MQVGQLQFFPGGQIIAGEGGGLSGQLLIMCFSITDFHNVVGILRNEKPLALYFDTDAKYGYVLTAAEEPVGELVLRVADGTWPRPPSTR
jgi:hypothetical protein